MKTSRLVARRGRFVLDVPALEITPRGTAVLGPNGAGKTTLLLALQGLIAAKGTIERPARAASVFAQPAVLRGTVRWNVSVVCANVLGIGRTEADARASALLGDVGLAGAADADARTLSTGQRQRLGLARALATEPRALFLDEPFANVDADGRPALRALIASYAARTTCVVAIATSSLADAVALCEDAVVLRGGGVTHCGGIASLAESDDPYVQALRLEASAAR